jgi:ADP-ribose diphosphatase
LCPPLEDRVSPLLAPRDGNWRRRKKPSRSNPLTDPQPPRRLIYKGLKIDLALQSVRLSDGTTADREVIIHRGAVALVPMVDDEHVCLVLNHRYSIGKTLLEVPAGTIDLGETPEQTAERELREETGYRAGRICRLRDWYVSPGVMSERMYLFLCEELDAGAPQLELDERLQTSVVEWNDALAMIDDGRIEDAKTIVALTICDRVRRRRTGQGA